MLKKIVFILTVTLSLCPTEGMAKQKRTLVIDAGHGGYDTGAVGPHKVREKDLTLKFALAFGKLVEQNCPDVKVIYTRKTDKFVELYRRAEIANQNKADLFISVHINAMPKGKRSVHGFQTYTLGKSRRTGKKTGVQENLEVAKRENAVIYLEKNYKQTYHGYDPNSPESDILFEFVQDKNMSNSIELAKYMQRYVCAATGRYDMGAHQDNLAVLRLTSMPGCLIELGFISSPNEEQFMNSKAATGRYARGIYNAFIAYKKRFWGNTNVAFLPEPEDEKPATAAKAEKPATAAKAEKPVAIVTTVAPADTTAPATLAVDTTAAAVLAAANTAPVAPADTTAPAIAVMPAPSPGSSVSPVSPVYPGSSGYPGADSRPVFKVQILVGSTRLPPGDRQLKGITGVGCFKENGLYKHTVGASANYQKIYQLRKSILDKFPQSFIIAFRNGERMDVQEAIREYRKNKKH